LESPDLIGVNVYLAHEFACGRPEHLFCSIAMSRFPALQAQLARMHIPWRVTRKTADPGEGQTFHLSSRSMKHRCSVRMYKVTPKMHPFLPANCYLILQHHRAYMLSLLSRTSIPNLIQAGLVRVKQRHLPSSTTHV